MDGRGQVAELEIPGELRAVGHRARRAAATTLATGRHALVAFSVGGRAALDSLVARSRGALWIGSVAGTGHLNFSDAPFVMGSTIKRFGGRIIAPQRGLLAITAAIAAFFDEALDGHSGALAAVPRRFPEVVIERQHH